MAMSAALSFRTIFALIPALVLAFLTLKSLGIVADKKQALHELLSQSGLSQITYVEQPKDRQQSGLASEPATQQVTLAGKIESVMTHVEAQLTVGRLGPIGVALLVWTVIALLTTIERSLNRIFQAPRSRSLARRVLLYWSAVTLGAIVVASAAYIGEATASILKGWPMAFRVFQRLGWAWPLVVGTVLVAGVYRLLPNTKVRKRAAVAGAAVAVPLWLIARWAFALYVERVGRTSVYGAMGLVPLFLMWLNLSWWVFLFGAELAHTAANLTSMQSAEQTAKRMLGPWDLLAIMLAVAGRNAESRGPVAIDKILGTTGLANDAALGLLDKLVESGLVCRVASETSMEYLPASPAEMMAVTDVLRIGQGWCFEAPAGVVAPKLARSLKDVRRKVESGIAGMTVGSLITNEEL